MVLKRTYLHWPQTKSTHNILYKFVYESIYCLLMLLALSLACYVYLLQCSICAKFLDA